MVLRFATRPIRCRNKLPWTTAILKFSAGIPILYWCPVVRSRNLIVRCNDGALVARTSEYETKVVMLKDGNIFKSKFARRTLSLFLAFTLIPLTAVSFFLYTQISGHLEKQAFTRLDQMTKSYTWSIYERLLLLEAELQLIAADTFRKVPVDAASRTALTLAPRTRRFTSIRFCPEGLIVRSDFGSSEERLAHFRVGKTNLVTKMRKDHPARVFMAVTSASAGFPLAAIVGEVNLPYLFGTGGRNALPPMNEMVVLDGTGALLISSVSSREKLMAEFKLNPELSDLHQFIWEHDGKRYQADAHRLFLKSEFATPDWTVILSQSRDYTLESVADFKALFPLVLLLAILIAFYLSIVFARRSLTPIEKLKMGTAAILEGKFNERLKFNSGDEFEELAESFNRMSENLGRQLKELRLNSEIGRLTARISSPSMLCRSVLRAIVRYMDYRAGVMYIAGKNGRSLESIASYGRSKEDIHHLITHISRSLAAQPEEFPARILRAKKIVLTDRAANHPADPTAALLDRPEAKARRMTIHAPVIYEETTIGLLIIERDGNEARLPEAERNFISSIASHLAVSLTNIESFRKMQQSEERFRKTFSHAASGIALITPDGKFVTVNDYLSKMLGYSGGGILNRTIEDISHPPDYESEVGAFDRLLRREVEFEVYEKRFVHKNGQAVWGLVSTTLIKDHQKRPLHFVYHVQDLTDLKQAQENQIGLKMQLQQAQKIEALGTLAGGIAHDFNNILFGLIGYAELGIMESNNSGKACSRFKDIIKAAERAADLIRQILAFSRKNEKNLQAVQISSLVKESLKLLRASLPSNIEIRQHMAANGVRVMADPTQIHQIILNLCTNALHAMLEGGGTLTVQLTREKLDDAQARHAGNLKNGSYLKMSVSDTGCGIRPEHADRIFEPYFTTKKAGKGTGLGLSVAHGIVREHGGAITVRSHPGRGTTFDVYLPESSPTPDHGEPNDCTLQRGCETILLVDDEKEITEVFGLALEKLGYRVEGMTDPGEALASFRRQPDKYDLVITDMTMPKLTGDKLAEEMMAIRPQVPIILCTGFNELITSERAYEMGIKKFVLKPWSLQKMSRAVRNVLDDSAAAATTA